MILEKNSFKKILIMTVLSLTFVLFLSVSPVHASVAVRDDYINYNVSNDGLKDVVTGVDTVERWDNNEFIFKRSEGLSPLGYRIYFDAVFNIDFRLGDVYEFNEMFKKQSLSFVFDNLRFTGFRFMYFAIENGGDPDVLHPFIGEVNLHDIGQGSFNMLNNFDQRSWDYELIVAGRSKSNDVNDLLYYEREVKIYEAAGLFPINSYNVNDPGNANLITYSTPAGGLVMTDFINEEYASFSPHTVKLVFKDVFFDFDPYRTYDGEGLWDAGPTPGYYLYDNRADHIGLRYDPDNYPNKNLTKEYIKYADLRFFNTNTAIPPGEGDGGAGNIFSIIPMIMVSIFSFFWVIGSVELGGIAGFTLVSVVTFFVGFMLVKFIIGLFKGGGD